MMGEFSKSVKPLLLLLSLSGLFILRMQHLSWRAILQSATSFFLWLVCASFLSQELWTAILVMATGHQQDGIVASLDILSVACQALAGTFFCLNISWRFPTFLSAVDSYYKLHYEEECPRRKINFLFIGIVFLLFIASLIAAVCFTFNCVEVWLSLLGFQGILHEIGAMIHCVKFYFDFHLKCANFILPLTLYLFIWLTLFLEARWYNRILGEEDFEKNSAAVTVIEDLRLRHIALSKLIELANDTLRIFFLLAFGSGIILVLLCLSVVILGDGSFPVTFKAFFSMSFMSFQLTVVTLTGAALNAQMNKPAQFLSEMKVNALKAVGMENVIMFLDYLRIRSFGFSVLGLFTIDVSTIRLVSGTIITYAVVILEFKSGNNSLPVPAASDNVSVTVSI